MVTLRELQFSCFLLRPTPRPPTQPTFWMRWLFVTARKRSLGQGNILAPVCHSVHRGGVPDTPVTWSRHPPRTWSRHPPGPGADTPHLDQVHPLGPGTSP